MKTKMLLFVFILLFVSCKKDNFKKITNRQTYKFEYSFYDENKEKIINFLKKEQNNYLLKKNLFSDKKEIADETINRVNKNFHANLTLNEMDNLIFDYPNFDGRVIKSNLK